MRQITFRGKRIDNGEWVYGSLLQSEIDVNELAVECEIHERFANSFSIMKYSVDPKTVGQKTGLKDKSGMPVFEGDFLYKRCDDVMEEMGFVEIKVPVAFKDGAFGWIGEITSKFYSFEECPLEDYEIKGNIYEHQNILI